jgi:hypothetical protein
MVESKPLLSRTQNRSMGWDHDPNGIRTPLHDIEGLKTCGGVAAEWLWNRIPGKGATAKIS